jgi:hypothetical protein
MLSSLFENRQAWQYKTVKSGWHRNDLDHRT